MDQLCKVSLPMITCRHRPSRPGLRAPHVPARADSRHQDGADQHRHLARALRQGLRHIQPIVVLCVCGPTSPRWQAGTVLDMRNLVLTINHLPPHVRPALPFVPASVCAQDPCSHLCVSLSVLCAGGREDDDRVRLGPGRARLAHEGPALGIRPRPGILRV